MAVTSTPYVKKIWLGRIPGFFPSTTVQTGSPVSSHGSDLLDGHRHIAETVHRRAHDTVGSLSDDLQVVVPRWDLMICYVDERGDATSLYVPITTYITRTWYS